jgi:hypothetical protein
VDEPASQTSGPEGAALAGIGCVTLIGGFFGGGMIAVAIAKFVGSIRGCRPMEGLPACNHAEFMLVGAVLGGILLPAVTIWKIRRGRSAPATSQRS